MREVPINVRNIKEKFNEGLESIIYYYTDPNYYKDDVLYKRFRSIRYIEDFNDDVKEDMLQNKYDKISIISTLACFKDEVKLYDIGLENDKMKGYTMKKSSLNPVTAKYIPFYDENKNIVNKLIYFNPNGHKLSLSDKIKYLKLIKEKIEKFNDSDIYIGDFNFANFLVSKDLDYMKLCDLDNLKIWSHDIDNKHISVKKYEEICMPTGDINQNIVGLDSYCFNIFTLSVFLEQSKTQIFRNLENLELPEILNEFPNQEIFDDIKHLEKSYKPRYLIDIFN